MLKERENIKEDIEGMFEVKCLKSKTFYSCHSTYLDTSTRCGVLLYTIYDSTSKYNFIHLPSRTIRESDILNFSHMLACHIYAWCARVDGSSQTPCNC